MSGVAAAPSGASPSPLSRARRALARFTGVGASKYDELEEVEFTKLRADDDGDGDGEDDGHDEDWEDALYAADAKRRRPPVERCHQRTRPRSCPRSSRTSRR